jgi:hypothetical protein
MAFIRTPDVAKMKASLIYDSKAFSYILENDREFVRVIFI